MVPKFGGQIWVTKFSFVPDWLGTLWWPMVMTPFLAACHNDSIIVKNGSCTHFYPNSSAIYAILPEKYCQSTKSKKDIRCCAHTQSDEDNYDLTTRGLTRPISVRKGLCKGAFTLARAGVRVHTAGPALRARTECSHMNKEKVFTLVRADVRARMRRKKRRVPCGNFPHPQAFLWLVHDILGVRKLSFQ